jgi:hypothetical protein
MSRRPTPTVNASLIHEARMIIQQFITGRQQMHHAARLAGVPLRVSQKPAVCRHKTLKCAFCTNGTEADTVVGGYAVCENHVGRARSIIAVTPAE